MREITRSVKVAQKCLIAVVLVDVDLPYWTSKVEHLVAFAAATQYAAVRTDVVHTSAETCMTTMGQMQAQAQAQQDQSQNQINQILAQTEMQRLDAKQREDSIRSKNLAREELLIRMNKKLSYRRGTARFVVS